MQLNEEKKRWPKFYSASHLRWLHYYYPYSDPHFYGIQPKSLRYVIDWYYRDYLFTRHLGRVYHDIQYSWTIKSFIAFLFFLILTSTASLFYIILFVCYFIYYMRELSKYVSDESCLEFLPQQKVKNFPNVLVQLLYIDVVLRAELYAYQLIYNIMRLLKGPKRPPLRWEGLTYTLLINGLWRLISYTLHVPKRVLLNSYAWSMAYSKVDLNWGSIESWLSGNTIGLCLVFEIFPIVRKRIYRTQGTKWNFNPISDLATHQEIGKRLITRLPKPFNISETVKLFKLRDFTMTTHKGASHAGVVLPLNSERLLVTNASTSVSVNASFLYKSTEDLDLSDKLHNMKHSFTVHTDQIKLKPFNRGLGYLPSHSAYILEGSQFGYFAILNSILVSHNRLQVYDDFIKNEPTDWFDTKTTSNVFDKLNEVNKLSTPTPTVRFTEDLSRLGIVAGPELEELLTYADELHNLINSNAEPFSNDQLHSIRVYILLELLPDAFTFISELAFIPNPITDVED